MVKNDVMSSFWRVSSPHPVALVTSISGDGKPNIITIDWITPISVRPPLLAVCIGKTRYSHRLIEETGEFVVNIPTQELIGKVEYCGSVSGRDVNKFEKIGLTPKPAKRVRPPIIDECIAHLECRVINQISTGDHSLFIGEVIAAYAEDKFFTTLWDVAKTKPLMHVGETTYTVPANPLKVS